MHSVQTVDDLPLTALEMKRLLIYALGLGCLSFSSALAQDSGPPIQYQQLLEAIPGSELSAKTVQLVRQAKSRERATTTSDVTKAAVTINPAVAPSVVSVIARAVPDMSATAAGTAAAEQPKQAAAIAKAAAAAAPSKACKIVVAVCRAVPAEYRSVAIVVAQTVPGSSREVLKAVASAIPELKAGVEKAMADLSSNSLSVAAVLDTAIATKQGMRTVMGPSLRGSTVGPPLIPISDTVRTVPPDTSGEVPTGGRDNSRP
jgi:hypothetical protein